MVRRLSQNDIFRKSSYISINRVTNLFRGDEYQSVGRRSMDEQDQISRDPRTKRLITRRESLAKPSQHASNSAFAHL